MGAATPSLSSTSQKFPKLNTYQIRVILCRLATYARDGFTRFTISQPPNMKALPPSPMTGPIPAEPAHNSAPCYEGKTAMKTDVEVTGQYLLTVVDDSNERWSKPEWVTFCVTRVMCLFLLVGGTWVLLLPQINPDAKLMATILAPAAGFKLIENASGNVSNKRHGTNGNGNGNGK